MTRTIAAAVVMLLAAGLLYSAMQIRGLSTEVNELRARVAHAEAPPAPRIEAEPTVVELPEAPSDGDIDLALQVDALQAEMAALKASLGISGGGGAADAPGKVASGGGAFVGAPTGPGGAPAAGQPPEALLAALTPEQQDKFRAAVLKVIADQKREEEQKQRLQMASKVISDMKKALGLTDQQADRVKQTLDQGTAKINDLRKQTTDANAGKMKKEIQGLWGSMDQGVRQLLTVDQVALYDTWRGTQIAKQYFGPPPRPQAIAPAPPKKK